MEPRDEVGSLWLTRPQDIHVHLACAASERRPVVLSGAGVAARGAFAERLDPWPLFIPDPKVPTPLPRIGATVKCDYYARNDAYSFFTRLVSLDPRGSWVLQSPLAVERCDRRVASRHLVMGVSGFCLSLVDQPGHPFLGLYDISSGGVSVVADPRRHHFEVEDRLNGQVHMPGEIPLAVELEVRHSRDFPRQSNLRIYG
ncbi:MAG: hypothetical protein FJ090_15655, partial [Deltaproteobacteria bacterium]|nr:hypothetical protein [Deltaproteobacteria bacterium]